MERKRIILMAAALAAAVIFIGGLCFMIFHFTEVAPLGEIQIEHISDDAESENLTIDVKVHAEDELYQYIGTEWDTDMIEGKKVISCRVYKKMSLRGDTDKGKTFSLRIPRETLTAEKYDAIYYYDDNEDGTLIWKK